MLSAGQMPWLALTFYPHAHNLVSNILQPIPVEKLVKCKMQYVFGSVPWWFESGVLTRYRAGTTLSSCSGSNASGTRTMVVTHTIPSPAAAEPPPTLLQQSPRLLRPALALVVSAAVHLEQAVAHQ